MLAALDYQRDTGGDFAGRVFLRRLGPDGQATHHLSLTEPGGAYWRHQIAFRDALRADPVLVSRYAELKRKLAADHGRSLEYTMAKTDFIREGAGVSRTSAAERLGQRSVVATAQRSKPD